jgi:hypothetical protein
MPHLSLGMYARPSHFIANSQSLLLGLRHYDRTTLAGSILSLTGLNVGARFMGFTFYLDSRGFCENFYVWCNSPCLEDIDWACLDVIIFVYHLHHPLIMHVLALKAQETGFAGE